MSFAASSTKATSRKSHPPPTSPPLPALESWDKSCGRRRWRSPPPMRDFLNATTRTSSQVQLKTVNAAAKRVGDINHWQRNIDSSIPNCCALKSAASSSCFSQCTLTLVILGIPILVSRILPPQGKRHIWVLVFRIDHSHTQLIIKRTANVLSSAISGSRDSVTRLTYKRDGWDHHKLHLPPALLLLPQTQCNSSPSPTPAVSTLPMLLGVEPTELPTRCLSL